MYVCMYNVSMYVSLWAHTLFTHCICEDWSYIAYIHTVSVYCNVFCKREHERQSLFQQRSSLAVSTCSGLPEMHQATAYRCQKQTIRRANST